MSWSTIANFFGFIFLAAACLTIVNVESARLGRHASRFVATLLAVAAYYGAVSIEGIVLELPAVKFEFLKYLVPVLGMTGIVYFGWKVYDNRDNEWNDIIRSGRKLLFVAGFALLARFLLSL